MKTFEMLLAQGATIQDALTALSSRIKQEYNDKACSLQQIFLLQEYRQASQVATNPNGQPAIQVVYNLVALISEELPTDHLQRAYKPLIDELIDKREQLMPIAQAFIAASIGAVIPEQKMPGT